MLRLQVYSGVSKARIGIIIYSAFISEPGREFVLLTILSIYPNRWLHYAVTFGVFEVNIPRYILKGIFTKLNIKISITGKLY